MKTDGFAVLVLARGPAEGAHEPTCARSSPTRPVPAPGRGEADRDRVARGVVKRAVQ
jgi:hypothetical protein